MAKNSQVIEMQAVDVLSLAISETQKLVPQITKGTTEPSWDGYIEIYDNPSLTKSSGLRRSPVQVKGHYKESILALGQPEIKHFVDISDLKAYYKEGGTAYFVVNIHDRKHY